jgi:riboflavin biosynthesis pyrimidine reductase
MACKGSAVQIPSAPPQVSGPLRPRPPANPGPRAADTVAAASVTHQLVSDPGECGAVMVGSGIQQADDPQLAVRDAEATRQPLRIVVDSNARTLASARVLDDAAPASSSWLMTPTPHNGRPLEPDIPELIFVAARR